MGHDPPRNNKLIFIFFSLALAVGFPLMIGTLMYFSEQRKAAAAKAIPVGADCSECAAEQPADEPLSEVQDPPTTVEVISNTFMLNSGCTLETRNGSRDFVTIIVVEGEICPAELLKLHGVWERQPTGLW